MNCDLYLDINALPVAWYTYFDVLMPKKKNNYKWKIIHPTSITSISAWTYYDKVEWNGERSVCLQNYYVYQV